MKSDHNQWENIPGRDWCERRQGQSGESQRTKWGNTTHLRAILVKIAPRTTKSRGDTITAARGTMRSNVGTVLVAIGTLQVNMARPSDTAQILADISYEVGAVPATSAGIPMPVLHRIGATSSSTSKLSSLPCLVGRMRRALRHR